MLHLMNAAVMPQDGFYNLRRLDADGFRIILQAAADQNAYRSSIGYPATQAWIEQLTGVSVPLSRDLTTLAHGDVMLIVKLKYRVANPAAKGQTQPGPDDWEYFACDFWRRET